MNQLYKQGSGLGFCSITQFTDQFTDLISYVQITSGLIDGDSFYQIVLFTLWQQRSSDPRSGSRQCRKNHHSLYILLSPTFVILLILASILDSYWLVCFGFTFWLDRLQMGEVVSTIPSWYSFLCLFYCTINTNVVSCYYSYWCMYNWM